LLKLVNTEVIKLLRAQVTDVSERDISVVAWKWLKLVWSGSTSLLPLRWVTQHWIISTDCSKPVELRP